MAVGNREQNRKLTEAEQKRLARFNQHCTELEAQGYRKTELTVGIVKANVVTIAVSIPLIAAALALFLLVNHSPIDPHAAASPLVFIAVLALIVVHELIHGFTWSFFAPHRFADIEFGFMKEYLTPYCTCTAPLPREGYIVGSLAPLVTLGIIPTAVAIATGSFTLLVVGLFMILGAGGDVMIVLMLLRHKSSASEQLICDHPTQAGSVLFER